MDYMHSEVRSEVSIKVFLSLRINVQIQLYNAPSMLKKSLEQHMYNSIILI